MLLATNPLAMTGSGPRTTGGGSRARDYFAEAFDKYKNSLKAARPNLPESEVDKRAEDYASRVLLEREKFEWDKERPGQMLPPPPAAQVQPQRPDVRV